MELVQYVEGTGGAQFEILEAVTPNQLVEQGAIEAGTIVFDPATKQKVEPNAVLQPGQVVGTTVQAELG